eukprot:CAMPEP_0170114766 /NCGR_PEP_ID=MMETSP0020_2-20130122/10953_1 /TAXON_ID=98059 /ORGANISM="Dinobryon sp., Strain UTEXLB2267" /LENGTH=692 /DNA_ID=CAMNT_0010341923 /DNA_START=911 /DNA_END=2992 /DNA_ORIENTATION=+
MEAGITIDDEDPYNDDDEDEEEIRRISSNHRSGYAADLTTAENHFKKFLVRMNKKNPSTFPTDYSVHAFNDANFICDALDRFATYLVEVAKIPKCSTSLAYLSKIKTKIMRDHKASNLFGDGKWYADIRTKIKSHYLVLCNRNGTNLVDHAPPMTETDQLIMVKLLMERNTRQADLDRGIVILQKQTIGRVSETSRLKFSNVGMCKTESRFSKVSCFTFSMTRLKTGQQHTLNIFLHAYSWLLCPAHALATIIASCYNPSEDIFPNIPEGNEAAYVNRLLADLYETWSTRREERDSVQQLSKDLSSHSARHGGAQDASDHKDIQLQWIIPRGGWKVDGIQTIFTYIVGTDNCDKRVARIESGWNRIDEGGVCPGIESFPIAERTAFNTFSINMLGSASIDIDTQTRQALCCVLLLHYREVKESYPEHRLIRKMHTCIVASDRAESALLQWADYVKEMFLLDNGIFLPLESMEGGGSIRVRDMDEFMRKVIEQLHENRLEINELRKQNHLLTNELNYIHNSNDNLHTKVDFLISKISTPSSSAEDPINYLEVQLPHILDEMNSFESPTALPSNRNLMESFFPSASGVPISSPQQQPAFDDRTMKSLTISAVFYDWFMNQRYDQVPQPSTRERFLFNETWKTIAHLKRFLPNNYTIRRKPSSNQDLSTWTQSLATISRQLQKYLTGVQRRRVSI